MTPDRKTEYAPLPAGRIRAVAAASAWAAQNADHVKINSAKIGDYHRQLFSKCPLVTHLDQEQHFISPDREATASYVLALDSINFGSGYFHRGLEYATVAGGLKKAFERGELNSPAQWAKATPEYFSRLLSVPLHGLAALFARHLRASGEKILSGYQGQVVHLLEQSGYSAAKLAEIVAAWDSFRDVHCYKGREIPFFKRAQILAADMHLALGGFKDMDRLTMFADNTVPHVLRCDGILEYDAALAAKIAAGVLLPSGGAEEVEIRAAAIHAVELIKQEAARHGLPVTSVNLDHMLWHRGYEPELYKRPKHRTLTTDY